MPPNQPTPSPRKVELLEASYHYALEHGLSDLSLRPLAAAVGSSPRVLIYLFGSKDALVRALLARARVDEVALMDRLGAINTSEPLGLEAVTAELWSWLTRIEHRPLLILWVEGYARSLLDATSAWSDFARSTVRDWLALLADAQPAAERDSPDGEARRTLALAVLRGGLLDLLATGDVDRTTAAVRHQLDALATPTDRRASG